MPSRPDAEPVGKLAMAAIMSSSLARRHVSVSGGGSTKGGAVGPGGCLDFNAMTVSGVSGAMLSFEKSSRAAPFRSPSCTFSSTFVKIFFVWLCGDLGGAAGGNCMLGAVLFLICCVSEVLLSGLACKVL